MNWLTSLSECEGVEMFKSSILKCIYGEKFGKEHNFGICGVIDGRGCEVPILKYGSQHIFLELTSQTIAQKKGNIFIKPTKYICNSLRKTLPTSSHTFSHMNWH